MDLPLHDLPDDVDALKAMVLAMAREQAEKEARLKAQSARSCDFGQLEERCGNIACGIDLSSIRS